MCTEEKRRRPTEEIQTRFSPNQISHRPVSADSVVVAPVHFSEESIVEREEEKGKFEVVKSRNILRLRPGLVSGTSEPS